VHVVHVELSSPTLSKWRVERVRAKVGHRKPTCTTCTARPAFTTAQKRREARLVLDCRALTLRLWWGALELAALAAGGTRCRTSVVLDPFAGSVPAGANFVAPGPCASVKYTLHAGRPPASSTPSTTPTPTTASFVRPGSPSRVATHRHSVVRTAKPFQDASARVNERTSSPIRTGADGALWNVSGAPDWAARGRGRAHGVVIV
jgi:hypothetical protein